MDILNILYKKKGSDSSQGSIEVLKIKSKNLLSMKIGI